VEFRRVRQSDYELENRIFDDMRWAARENSCVLVFLEAEIELVKQISMGKII